MKTPTPRTARFAVTAALLSTVTVLTPAIAPAAPIGPDPALVATQTQPQPQALIPAPRAKPWNVIGHTRTAEDVCMWEDLGWEYMSPAEQVVWSRLGWNQRLWDGEDGNYPESDDLAWEELSGQQRWALQLLGYDEESWDAYDCGEELPVAEEEES